MLSYKSTWIDILVIGCISFITNHPLLTILIFYSTLIGSLLFSRLLKYWDTRLYKEQFKAELATIKNISYKKRTNRNSEVE